MLNPRKVEKSKVILRGCARKMQDLYKWLIKLVNIKEEEISFCLVPSDPQCCGSNVQKELKEICIKPALMIYSFFKLNSKY